MARQFWKDFVPTFFDKGYLYASKLLNLFPVLSGTFSKPKENHFKFWFFYTHTKVSYSLKFCKRSFLTGRRDRPHGVKVRANILQGQFTTEYRMNFVWAKILKVVNKKGTNKCLIKTNLAYQLSIIFVISIYFKANIAKGSSTLSYCSKDSKKYEKDVLKSLSSEAWSIPDYKICQICFEELLHIHNNLSIKPACPAEPELLGRCRLS